jgi:para-nitrobenzyl esterase
VELDTVVRFAYFVSLRRVGEAFDSNGASNLGLRDATLALEWVQENVAAFGGDPSKVRLDQH